MLYIFDLDGTLIDSSHRQLTLPDGSLDLAHWRENSTRERIRQDRLLPLANVAKRLIVSRAPVIACTARLMGAHDYEFLTDNGLRFDLVLSRPESCALPDNLLKVGLLADFAKQTGREFRKMARFSLVYDDNVKVCKTLRHLGFNVQMVKS
jgi:FMN phosphatase YigB (HAD superfamily)